MSERKASMGDMVYRGDVIKYIRNNISSAYFVKKITFFKTAFKAKPLGKQYPKGPIQKENQCR